MAEEKMTMETKEVLKVLEYMHEHNTDLETSCKAIGIPDEMLQTVEMKLDEMAVVCHETIGYMHEHNVTLKAAYDEIDVPKDMRMTTIEIIEFLYPKKITQKNLEELLIEHYD